MIYLLASDKCSAQRFSFSFFQTNCYLKFACISLNSDIFSTAWKYLQLSFLSSSTFLTSSWCIFQCFIPSQRCSPQIWLILVQNFSLKLIYSPKACSVALYSSSSTVFSFFRFTFSCLRLLISLQISMFLFSFSSSFLSIIYCFLSN